MIIRKMLSMFQLKRSFKYMLKHRNFNILFLLCFLFFTSAPVFAAGDIVMEIVKEQFWESLANFNPYDPEASKLEKIQNIIIF